MSETKLIVIIIDITTPGHSIAPFGCDDLRQWLDMIDGMKSTYLQVY